MSTNVVSKAISVGSIYYYTHNDATVEIKRGKDTERNISVAQIAHSSGSSDSSDSLDSPDSSDSLDSR